MKIFGKKKKGTVSDSSQDLGGGANAQENLTNDNSSSSLGGHNNVPSYFSSNFFKMKKNHSKSSSNMNFSSSIVNKVHAPSVDELMLKDPTTLTSKERRILRRHCERQNLNTEEQNQPQPHAVGGDEVGVMDIDTANPIIKEDSLESNLVKQPTLDTTDLIRTLEGLNSKERRQKLRTWKQHQLSCNYTLEDVEKALEKIKEEAKKIGVGNRDKIQIVKECPAEEENQQQLKEVDSHDSNKKKRKRENADADRKSSCHNPTIQEKSNKNHDSRFKAKTDKTKMKDQPNQQDMNSISMSKSAKTATSPKSVKDWSHLSPEERKRRELQRQLQKEAQDRRQSMLEGRESGLSSPTSSSALQSSKKYKHPLNSERRRANRRKPSGSIVKMLANRKYRT